MEILEPPSVKNKDCRLEEPGGSAVEGWARVSSEPGLGKSFFAAGRTSDRGLSVELG